MDFSLYVHIPFCRQKCDYCDFFSIPSAKDCLLPDKKYVDAVLAECNYLVKQYCVTRWKTVYIGGGTPSQLGNELLMELVEGIKDSVKEKKIDEFTIEMNPEDVTAELLKTAGSCGIDRLSIGIQALDDKALKTINRHCSVEMVYSALELIEQNWKKKLSVDFIAGLPCQTYDSFKSQFEKILKYRIDHISLYTLTVEENTPLYKKIESGKIRWNPEKADRMWIIGRNILEKKGFAQYEVSNFSKPGFKSLHNQTYWNLNSYLGCGAGACSSVYSKQTLRWTNTTSIKKYEDFWLNNVPEKRGELSEIQDVEFISKETEVFEYLMMGFRLLDGVCAEDFNNRFNLKLEERIGANDGVFADWKKRGVAKTSVVNGKTYYSLTGRGIMLLNQFLELLL